jgi:hypothetical protein
MRFGVLMVVTIKKIISCKVRPCSVITVYRHFGETCCLHLRVDRSLRKKDVAQFFPVSGCEPNDIHLSMVVYYFDNI